MKQWIFIIQYFCFFISIFRNIWVHFWLYKFRVGCLAALFSLAWYLKYTFIYCPDLALNILLSNNTLYHSFFSLFTYPPIKYMICRFWCAVPWIMHIPYWNKKNIPTASFTILGLFTTKVYWREKDVIHIIYDHIKLILSRYPRTLSSTTYIFILKKYSVYNKTSIEEMNSCLRQRSLSEAMDFHHTILLLFHCFT